MRRRDLSCCLLRSSQSETGLQKCVADFPSSACLGQLGCSEARHGDLSTQLIQIDCLWVYHGLFLHAASPEVMMLVYATSRTTTTHSHLPHSLTPSLTHSLTHSPLTHSLIHSRTHSLTHSLPPLDSETWSILGVWIKFLKSREREGMGEVWTNNRFFLFLILKGLIQFLFYHKLDNFFLFFHYMFVYLFPLHSPLPFSFQDWQNHLWVWNQSETGLKPQTSLYSQHFAHSFLSLFFLFFLFIFLLFLFSQVFLAFPCVSPFSFLFPVLVAFTLNVRFTYPFPFLFPVLFHFFPFIFHFLFLLILFFLLVLHRAPPRAQSTCRRHREKHD